MKLHTVEFLDNFHILKLLGLSHCAMVTVMVAIAMVMALMVVMALMAVLVVMLMMLVVSPPLPR